MKETINAHIGAQAFTLDCDAYTLLQSYLDEIRDRLPANDTESLSDIELRIAEILQEKCTSPLLVITQERVRMMMQQMGAPETFGERHTEHPTPSATPPAAHRLYRSRSNRSIAGICGGLGTFFNLDISIIRLLMLVMILCGGLSFWVYILLWIIIPEEPAHIFNLNDKK